MFCFTFQDFQHLLYGFILCTSPFFSSIGNVETRKHVRGNTKPAGIVIVNESSTESFQRYIDHLNLTIYKCLHIK